MTISEFLHQNGLPLKRIEERGGKTVEIVYGKGQTRARLALSGFEKKELQLAERRGLICKDMVFGRSGGHEIFYYVPVEETVKNALPRTQKRAKGKK